MDIVIRELPEMRVASYRSISASPETEAWSVLSRWARERGLFDGPFRIFGFNDPNPKPGVPEYGYRFRITVADDVEGGDGVEIETVPGGRFAVGHIEVNAVEDIGAGWKEFGAALREQGLVSDEPDHCPRWYEEHLDYDPDHPGLPFGMDLYVELAA
jgi:DNA gyrase inhibitor GyrI